MTVEKLEKNMDNGFAFVQEKPC